MPGTRAYIGGLVGEGRGQALQSKAVELQLGISTATKGAISDREMATFGAATPGLQMTDDGAATVLNGWEAAAARKIEQANFMEEWAAENGNLMGAQQAWQKFITENPVIRSGREGRIEVNKENIGNWSSYIRTDGGVGSLDNAAPRAPEMGTPVNIDGKTYYLGPDGEVYE